MKKLLFLLFLCYNLGYSQYTEVYYNDFKSGAALTEWSTDKPIAEDWSNPIQIEITPKGNRNFLGLFGKQKVFLKLTDMPTHDSIKIEFQLFVIKSWDGNYGSKDWGPDIFSIFIDNMDIYHTTFSNLDNVYQDYPSIYVKGSPNNNPFQYMADEVNTLGYYHNSQYDYYDVGDAVYYYQNEKSIITHHTKSNIEISFSGNLVEPSYPNSRFLENESWGLALVKVSINDCQTILPSLTLSTYNVGCDVDSVKLQTESGYIKYEWYDENGKLLHSGSNTYYTKKSGKYYVKVYDANGCEGVSEIKEVSMDNDSNSLSFSFSSSDNTIYFDTTNILQSNCKELTIHNNGDDDFTLNDIYIFRNISYSLPQSQFPITIPAKDSVVIQVCFSPVVLGNQRDTLMIIDKCGNHYIFLEAYCIPNGYESDSKCNAPVYMVTKELNEDYSITVFPAYPNPSSGIIHIPYQINYLQENRNEIYSQLYNSLGTKLMSIERVINTIFKNKNSLCETGEFTINSQNLINGIYKVIIIANNQVFSIPITVLK